MNILVKVVAAVIAGSALGLVIKQQRPELSLLIAVALSVFTIYLSLDIFASLLEFLRWVADEAGIPNATVSIVLKTAGVSIVTKFIADICRESGQGSAASGVEFAGAAAAVYIALPLFEAVLNMLKSVL